MMCDLSNDFTDLTKFEEKTNLIQIKSIILDR